MKIQNYKSPLHEMSETMLTDFWNDSCSVDELEHALEYGAVGATTNPIIVGNVLNQDLGRYENRIIEIVNSLPEGTEDDITWKINEEMAQIGANILLPVFESSKGQKGRISIQTNTKYYRNWNLLLDQALHFFTLAPNIQIKIPATKAGIKAIEEATYRGISINATVSFSVAQALAVADAVEKALNRRLAEGKVITGISPVCTIMLGRIDDWLKEVVKRDQINIDPLYLDWSGIAIFKYAYRIFKERGYQTRLLSAAYRHEKQWTELMGGDVILTIPHSWIKQFNESKIKVESNIDKQVEPIIISALSNQIPDFKKAYDPNGMSVDEFDSFGAVNKTLQQFLVGYDQLVTMIRKYMIIIQ
jgi:transaldolase